MQKLAEAVRQAAETFNPTDPEMQKASDVLGADDLIAAAQAWSSACIAQMRGDTLKKGLAISLAICEFVDNLETDALKPRKID